MVLISDILCAVSLKNLWCWQVQVQVRVWLYSTVQSPGWRGWLLWQVWRREAKCDMFFTQYIFPI